MASLADVIGSIGAEHRLEGARAGGEALGNRIQVRQGDIERKRRKNARSGGALEDWARATRDARQGKIMTDILMLGATLVGAGVGGGGGARAGQLIGSVGGKLAFGQGPSAETSGLAALIGGAADWKPEMFSGKPVVTAEDWLTSPRGIADPEKPTKLFDPDPARRVRSY